MTDWHISSAVRTNRGLLLPRNADGFFLDGKTFITDAMNRGGRMENEDANAFQLYAVLDGVGGGEAGQWAGLETARMLQTLCDAYPCGISEAELRYVTLRMSDRLHRLAGSSEKPAGVTIAACLWHKGIVRVLNVGNCRVYRLRRGKLTQLSEDHTEVQRMVDLGMITPYQARVSPERHLVSQYLGMDASAKEFEPFVSEALEARPRDVYLLCSDGLCDMVEDTEIRKILLKSRDAAEAADKLTQQALDNGGRDNITAMCFTAHGYSRVWGVRRA